jgi:transmembrane sensor
MNDLDWELFDRYLANAATPAERDEFERWLSERPERSHFVTAWHRALENMETGIAAADREAVWAGPLESVGGTPVKAPRARHEDLRPSAVLPGKQPRSTWGLGAGIAAAVLVAGAAMAGWTLLRNTTPTPPAERVVTVPRGERGQFRLPDGSRVMLAAGSSLRHPADFAPDSRDVTLEGEAYFAVEHDAGRPFRVHAGDLVATDRGTEFLVRAYPEDAGARVVVRSGLVAVQPRRSPDGSSHEQVVKPGQLGRLAAGAPLVERADTAAYFAWTRGTLVFDGTPLRQALPQLSRWYNLQFQLADTSLGSIPLSGRLDQTLTDARLDLLAGSLGLQQVRHGDMVILSRP